MKPIALKPPKPAITVPRRTQTVPLCSSCDKPLSRTGECGGCTK